MKKWFFFSKAQLSTKDLGAFYLVRCPYFSVGLHFLNAPSAVPDMHDHPRSFFSIVLRGWYCEKRCIGVAGKIEYRHVFLYNFFRADRWDRHRIVYIPQGGCITLAFEGPKIREWGFHTPQGWKPWREYLAK